jgi:tetratricopeptide (TPR) repeat protein/mono/diheme cytochrome c family protein
MMRLMWVILLWLVASTVSAGEADRDLARKAQHILKTHCYRCHGQEGAVEGGLNYVLDFKALVSRKKVIPGEPAASRLYKRLINANNPMPPDDEKTRPSRDEIGVIKQWIEAGAPDVVDPRAAGRRSGALLTEADMVQAIHDDLEKLEPRSRPFARYFTITHLYNAGLSEDELQTYRHGLAKLVNSLSWEPRIAVPRVVDEARTILAIDLRDYRWSPAAWKGLVDRYPYGIVHAAAIARQIYAATECELPYIRADWFVFAAARPPLYHDVLQLPRSDTQLERDLGIDVAANIQEGRVARAGFNGSGVSRNNRLLERHAFAHGAYWKSYDFAGNTGRQNLFAHPLGPGTDAGTFKHDGGEIIFNLPNGLQAYLLVDGQGNRIDEGPTKIVSVKNKPDPTVINGISCMACHARGMIDKADQIRAHADKNPAAFTEEERRAIGALYPPEADFRGLLRKDAERFRRAVEATGVRLGQTEPVVALAGRFEAELDCAAAAAELGLPPEVLLRGLEQPTPLAQRVGALATDGGTVQRQVFVDSFAELVQLFRLGKSLAALNQAIAEATAAIGKQPGDAAAFLARGAAYFDKGDHDRAIADTSEAIRLCPNAQAYRQRGMAHAGRGDLARAIADYDEALRRAPRDADTWHNRGLAEARLGHAARAIADLSEVLRLEPGRAAAWSDRGLLHGQRGDHDRALADLSEALRLTPRATAALVRRGDVCRLKGDWPAALADYSAALELHPKFALAHHGRGLAHRGQARHDKAIADLNEAVRLDPRNAAAANDLAQLLATCPEEKWRDGRRALLLAEQACRLTDHRRSDFLETLAAAHAEVGQFAEAVRWTEKALQHDPANPAALRNRLESYRKAQTGQKK